MQGTCTQKLIVQDTTQNHWSSYSSRIKKPKPTACLTADHRQQVEFQLQTVSQRCGSELTNPSYDLVSCSESISIKRSNILAVNWGREEGSEGGGRKRSKKSCMRIGPTKKGPISSARHDKMSSRFSYRLNLSVVELLVCTGVADLVVKGLWVVSWAWVAAVTG